MKNKIYLFVLVLAVAIIGFCNTVMAQSYGDIKVVASIENLDEEWIVVEKSDQNYTIKYVGGAKYGDIESTINKDVLPENWVVVDLGNTKTTSYIIKYIKGAANGTIQPVRFLENIPNEWKEYITIDGYYTIKYEGQTPVNINSDTGLYRYKYGDEGYSQDCYKYHNFWLLVDGDRKFIGDVSYGTIEKLEREWLKSGWISIGVDESNNESKMKCIRNAKPGDIEYSKLTELSYDYYLSDGWIVTHYNSTTREAVIKYLGKDASKQYAYGDTLTSPHIKLTYSGTPLPENWVSISADKIMYIGGRKSIGTKLDIYFSEDEDIRLPNSKNWVWLEYGKTILYVGTPAYGTEIDIDENPSGNYLWGAIKHIPEGWVFTTYNKNASVKPTIKFLNGAKYGDHENIIYDYITCSPNSCYNELPKGWIVDNYDEIKKLCSIKYISGGAGYGTQMTLKRFPKNSSGDIENPKLPMGWILTTVDSETCTITCLEGAKFGDVQYMYAKRFETDILPEGWVPLSYDTLTSQVKLTYIKGDVPLYTKVTAQQYFCINDFWDLLPDGWVCNSRCDGSDLLDLKYYGENYPEIGQTIDFTLKDQGGHDVNLNTFKGRNMLIVYNWYDENLNSIIEELPDVQVINISYSEENEYHYDAVNYMLKDTNSAFAKKYTVVRDNETTNEYAYTYWYLNPTYLFVDKDMKILSKKVQISEKEAIKEAKRLFDQSTPEEEETGIIFGDIDNSSSANSIDFGLMRQYLLGNINEFSYENGLKAADVDGNGSFNSIDFAFMRQYLLGIINEFPAQNKLVATPTPTITPTITPTPSGGLQIDSVKANPDALFVNQAEDVIFTAGISNFEYDSELTIELNKTDEKGNIIEKLGILNDAGVDGDEKAGDNIYSFKKNMSYSTTQTLHFTVTATQDKVQRTAGVDLRVLNKVTDEEMKENCAFQEEQVKRYVELIASEGIESAKNVMLSELNSNPKIQQAGVSDGSDSIWFEYKNGILGAISIRKKDETDSTSEESVNTPTTDQTSAEIVTTVDSNAQNSDTLSSSGSNDKSILFSAESPTEVKGPRIANRKVLMLSPMLHEFGINDSNDMNSYTPNVYETLKKYKYNDADVFRDSDITYLKDKEVTISFLRTELYKYGVISLSSHGENLFQTLRSEPLWGMRDGAVGGQVGFFLAQSYEDSASTVEKDKILRDLQMHRLAIFTLYDEDKEKIIGSNYFVLPSFIEKYFQNIYVNNLVLMGCCKSAYNETMANAFIKSGARTYLGYSDYVPNYIARDRTSLFLSKFLEQSTTAKSAYDAADASVSSKKPTHPGQPPAQDLFIKFLGEPNLKPPVPFLDLGTLGGNSEARSINCKGQVVGKSKVGDQEFPVLWEEGDICKLNDYTSWAFRINDQSEIFMSYEGYVDWDAEYFDYYSTMYTIGYIWNKGDVSYYSDHRYLDINDKGQKIGYYTNPGTYKITGFLIDNGTYKDLGNFIPIDINNKGQIVGDALIEETEGVDRQRRSFLYENGVFTDLGSLNSKAKKVSFPGNSIESELNYLACRENVWYRDTFGRTDAEAINEKGQIVGSSYIGDDSITKHAFLWENGVMKDLGTLGGQNNNSYAYDINNEGVIVGGSGSSIETFHPFLWKDSVMTNLSDVGTFGILDYKSSAAYSINDLGQVAGNDYSGKAVLWTP
ncbi:dockerin type I domain-containing protein [Acetivibrio cellulolyticus]|uniref:dockerin type I domain-containing protein n=1 Tax=Acetivibrio cellulolyticus TaxID=35830 RepID=UPI0001E2CBCD|nr:dockerin type I domain-containing protein [Acetivibrio cellulolyticus]